MKKESKSVRKDYSKFDPRDLGYYGIFRHPDFSKIDTKRFLKTVGRSVPCEIRMQMSRPRGTVYLLINKKSANDYAFNRIWGHLENLMRMWHEEILPAMKTIETPYEAQEEARLDKISGSWNKDDYEDIESSALLAGAMREGPYTLVFALVCSGFVHVFFSELTGRVLGEMIRCGQPQDSQFGKGIMSQFAKEHGGRDISEYRGYEKFEEMRLLWNFLKHDSADSYEALKKMHKELINDKTRFRPGECAIPFIKWDLGYIDSAASLIRDFIADFCSETLKEEIGHPDWFYSDYFVEKAMDSMNELH